MDNAWSFLAGSRIRIREMVKREQNICLTDM
jgi:hypothetical protein